MIRIDRKQLLELVTVLTDGKNTLRTTAARNTAEVQHLAAGAMGREKEGKRQQSVWAALGID